MARLSRLTDPVAVERAMDEFDALGRDEFLRRYGFGEARDCFAVSHASHDCQREN